MKKAICISCQREFPLNDDQSGIKPPFDEDVIIEFWEYPDARLDPRRESLISQQLNQGNLPVLCENCETEVDVASLSCPVT